MVQIPTEKELTSRIGSHLARCPGREDVVLAWLGYLAGLAEWSLIDIPTHDRLVDLLPPGDRRAVIEIALGEYADDHPELGRVVPEASSRAA